MPKARKRNSKRKSTPRKRTGKTTRSTTRRRKTNRTKSSGFSAWIKKLKKKRWSILPEDPKKKKPVRKRKRKKKLTFKQKVAKACVMAVAWGIVIFIGIVIYFVHDIPDFGQLQKATRRPTITLLSEQEEVIAKVGDLRGDYISYQEIPEHLIQAVLSTEDRRFFEHYGIDLRGIARAFLTNIRKGKIVQGGSTISQQLAKITFLTPERTIKRKVQVAILAFRLEREFTKEQILAMYLNKVYLGGGNYGIDAASRYYYNKPVTQISLPQAAVIAGLLKAPSRYNPYINESLALQRASEVMHNMLEAGYITRDEYEVAVSYPLSFKKNTKVAYVDSRYFADYIVEQLHYYMGRVEGDYVVVTTLSPRMQQIANRVVKNHFNDFTKNYIDNGKIPQVALVTLNNDGAIKAMVGGRDYSESQFNRAVSAYRQPGSAFKLFVYLAAFQEGVRLEDRVEDEPVDIAGYKPKNYKDFYRGSISIKDAIAHSANSVAIQIGKQVGIDSILHMAGLLGMTNDFSRNLSIALGTSEVRLVDLVQAYAHIPSYGLPVEAYAIKEVRDTRGRVLYKRGDVLAAPALSSEVVSKMSDGLQAVMEYGTGKTIKTPFPVAGKTGTSQQHRDAWFVGYSAHMTTGVWVGNDDGTPMEDEKGKGIPGSSLPAHIWRDFMRFSHKGLSVKALPTAPKKIKRPRFKSLWNKLFSDDVEYDYPKSR